MPTLRELTEYHKPETIEDAMKLLRRTSVKTVPIAGGTSLVPSATQNVQAVVDLGALGLSYVKGLSIGATTTLQAIVDHADLRTYADGVLTAAVLDTASRQTREGATLAGSIVSAAGNSPLFTALLALDARLLVRTGRGAREEEVALPYWTPQPRALILQVTLPALTESTHVAYEKVARTPADLPIVCVAARATIDQGELRDIRLALGGVGEKPIVITQPAGSIEELAQLAISTVTPADDYFASADYRREMIGVLTKRVLSSLAR
jgi:CO/xanthine dehydrogenase FAD-binding subunit